ncbi:hypothetical protein GCM10027176_71730 [Actinoallomurus bryophytorum]|uniref:Uncharacterized protein DUF4440 n=1 Tax=Actinoallomurus bryophytorum TaxID=1490222 RepID=A0A543CUY9_9ACTN|nr:nuclear transport factor 2 family protein [Actinoallomurus bryophytorum]TQM00859.1 uncharacterized protein DUF4440 [Actinoallomurus bryophytorum]
MTVEETDVTEFSHKWAEAELNGDETALKSLLDDGFSSVGPAGFILDKEQWIDRYRSGDLKNQEFAWHDTDVRRYGDTAIIIGVQTQKTTYKGNPVPANDLRFTQIAVRKDGQWYGVGMHLSAIMQPPTR